MPLPIVTAAQRLSGARKINMIIGGPSGVGKTTLCRTLDPNTTLFLDGEAGVEALGEWSGDVLDMRKMAVDMRAHPWEIARALACLLCGPDTADYEMQPGGILKPGPYSPESYEAYKQTFGDPADLFGRYTQIFTDSITVASRWSFAWANTQPERISDKGKIDKRGAYGLHGQEMVKWLTMLQHVPGKSMIVVGILDRFVDDLKRVTFELQIEGSKAGRELPGIFDQVLTLNNFKQDASGVFPADQTQAGQSFRALVCHQDNPWGMPAKDRTGKLELLERPDLGELLNKIRTGKRLDEKLVTALPPAPETQAAAALAAAAA
jgi:hypothetical protein